MTSGLFQLARAVSAPGAEIVAAGFAEGALPAGVSALDPAKAPPATATGRPAPTAVVLADRAAGLPLPAALDLARGLAESLDRVILAVRADSALQTAAGLAGALAEAGVNPDVSGLLATTDPVAPGCPVAVIARAAAARAPRVLALITCREQPLRLAHQAAELRAAGAEVVALDLGGLADCPDPGAEVAPAAASEIAAVVERLGAEREADWIAMIDADQRLTGPWPGLGLAETIGRLEALGGDHVAATQVRHDVLAAVGDEDPAVAARNWRFAGEAAAFGRVVAWKRERPPAGAARKAPYHLVLHRFVQVERPALTPEMELSWEAVEERGAWLAERLTGHGVFALTHPNAAGLRAVAEERLVGWTQNVLKTGIARLPYPDPLAPRAGVFLVRWDTVDGAPGSLWGGREGEPERLLAAGPRGTVALEGMGVNDWHVVRLYDSDSRSRLLGEMRLGFLWDASA